MSFNDKGLSRRIELEITLKKKRNKKDWALSIENDKLLCVILYRSEWEKKKESKGNIQAGGCEKKGKIDGPVGQLLSVFRVIDVL